MDKNEEKIKYLLAHINEGKTADELNSDFEKWYQEECIVRKFNERVEALKEAEKKFLTFHMEMDERRRCYIGNYIYTPCEISKPILLKDLVRQLQLKHAYVNDKDRSCVRITMYNKSKDELIGRIMFNNLCEFLTGSEYLLDKYCDHIVSTHLIYTTSGSNKQHEYLILISDNPIPCMTSYNDFLYLDKKCRD